MNESSVRIPIKMLALSFGVASLRIKKKKNP